MLVEVIKPLTGSGGRQYRRGEVVDIEGLNLNLLLDQQFVRMAQPDQVPTPALLPNEAPKRGPGRPRKVESEEV